MKENSKYQLEDEPNQYSVKIRDLTLKETHKLTFYAKSQQDADEQGLRYIKNIFRDSQLIIVD